MIEVNHFYKSYASQNNNEYAVQDVSFIVPKGKIIGLLGPNGSGKTTIMKALCGIHYATKGYVKINEIDLSQTPQAAMQFTGYVPEISVLPKDFSVKNFLEYVCNMHDISDITQAINLVSKQCSLEKILNKKIKNLSKGQQQRVSFAQCLIYNPENLILDEPISGLDPAQIQQMRSLIKELSKTKAILLSTHIMQEVSSLCDEIYILNNGCVVAKGTEKQIAESTQSKNIEEAFIKLTKDAQSNE